MGYVEALRMVRYILECSLEIAQEIVGNYYPGFSITKEEVVKNVKKLYANCDYCNKIVLQKDLVGKSTRSFRAMLCPECAASLARSEAIKYEG